MFDEYSDIMTVEDVCEALHVGRNRCYQLLGTAQVKGFRIGGVWKIPREAVTNFVRESSAARKTSSSTISSSLWSQ